MDAPKPISLLLIVSLLIGLTFIIAYHVPADTDDGENPTIHNTVSKISSAIPEWIAPDTNSISSDEHGELIKYGRRLIANTSHYLGPRGTIAPISNGMNCQNCHLEAGTKPWANNFGGVFSTYPKQRDRSGGIETISKRVNDCFERSLNATKGLDADSREMKAIHAYMEWLGKDVPAKTKPLGSAIEELSYMDRAADPLKGAQLFALKCQTCHGPDGKGLGSMDGRGFVYPPLWGDNSYTTAAGLYRITRLAGFIKSNMPNGSTHESPALTDEEAWDIAAFVNSQPRPLKNVKKDWPDLSKKPIDYPFGPYHDDFSETQHKYGPFQPIAEKRKEMIKRSEMTRS